MECKWCGSSRHISKACSIKHKHQMLLDGIPLEKCGFDAVIEVNYFAPVERCIYLAEKIKDSPVLRRKVSQRSKWLETLIKELQALKPKGK